jgi:uncharacterized protein (TIGR02145 family)
MEMKSRIVPFALFIVSVFVFSCEEKKDFLYSISPWVKYGSLTDIEGNAYKSIIIGNQTWMVDNLTTTTFNDGTEIPLVKDAGLWDNLSTPAACWQNNDPARKVTYGVLYNWYTVSTGKLCPKGWHVPDDGEWDEMINFLGGDNVAGGKLKEAYFSHWRSPNSEASDITHFRALPGGERLNGPYVLFDNLGSSGSWWATESIEDLASERSMHYNNSRVQKSYRPKKSGLSVRCISDIIP